MFLPILILVASLCVVMFGASKMTDGASGIALKMRIPPLIVGLTIVAMGTSAPELFVSLMSALNGSADLAVGNVVGSNIFNNLMIVGAVTLIAPQTVSRETVWRDIPFCVAGSILLLLCLLPYGDETTGTISRWESLGLLAIFVWFMQMTVKNAKKGNKETEGSEPANETDKATPSIIKSLCLILLGLACLIIGSDYFVQAAADIAKALNVSDAVIGLTIVGAGTSLPELATSIVAALKGQGEMAIGNVIGSNVFNIFMILGLTGIICPMSPTDISLTTIAILTSAAIFFWLFSFTKYKLERWEGAVLMLGCVAYLAWLVA